MYEDLDLFCEGDLVRSVAHNIKSGNLKKNTYETILIKKTAKLNK